LHVVHFRIGRTCALFNHDVPNFVSSQKLFDPHGPNDIILRAFQFFEVIDALLGMGRDFVCNR
jgi:hypothetical protein